MAKQHVDRLKFEAEKISLFLVSSDGAGLQAKTCIEQLIEEALQP